MNAYAYDSPWWVFGILTDVNGPACENNNKQSEKFNYMVPYQSLTCKKSSYNISSVTLGDIFLQKIVNASESIVENMVSLWDIK